MIKCGLEDVDTQRKGGVFVQYKVGTQTGLRPNRQLLFRGARLTTALPCRAIIHCCLGVKSFPFLQLFKYSVQRSFLRNRMRMHVGSNMECLHALLSFGIPREAIPVTDSGGVSKDYHFQWLTSQAALEAHRRHQTASPPPPPEPTTLVASVHAADNNEDDARVVPSFLSQQSSGFTDMVVMPFSAPTEQASSSMAEHPELVESLDLGLPITTEMVGSSTTTSEMVIVPCKRDILSGSGKRSQTHPGNMRLNMFLEQHLPEYDTSDDKRKRAIVQGIIHAIHKDGGRFLKLDKSSNCWHVLTEKATMERVSVAFRTVRKQMKKKNGEGGGTKRGLGL